MPRINIDRKQILQLLSSLVIGLSIGSSLFGRLYRLMSLSRTAQYIIIFALFILSISSIWLLLRNLILPWFKTSTNRNILLWLGLCLASAGLVVNAVPAPPQIPTASRVLEIIADINPASQTADGGVRLVEIKDNKGNKIPFHLLEARGSWSERDGMLVCDGREFSTLQYKFSARGGRGEFLYLLFSAHPGSSPVTIHLDGMNLTEALDEDSTSVREIALPLRPHPLYACLIYGSEILALAFLTLVFAVLYTIWLKKTPKTAVQVLLILYAAALALVIASSSRVSASLTNPDVREYFNQALWLPLVLWGSILAAVCFKQRQYISPAGIFLPLMIAMIFCYGLLADWNRFLVAPDSYGYVNNPKLRPPVYPMLVNLATTGTDFDHNASRFEDHTPVTDTDEPLMRVSRIQKIFLFTCSIILVYAMSYALGFWSMPLNALFMLWLYLKGFFPLEMDYILVEAVAQGWLFLLLAAMLAFFRSGKAIYILLSGVLVALLYLTRSASAYAGIIVLAVVLWAVIKDWRKYWKVIIVSAMFSLLIVMLPVFNNYVKTGKFVLSPQYASAKVLFSMYVAEPEDMELMPDDVSKEFLTRALLLRQEEAERIEAEFANSLNAQYFHTMASNVWLVAYPAAGELTSSPEEAEALMYRVSQILLQEHRSEYVDVGLFALQMTARDITRLALKTPQLGFWHLMLIAALLCILVRDWYGLGAAACLLSHLAHILVQCFYNVPDTRHIYASEFLLLLAYYLLLWGIIHKIADRKNTNVSSENDLREVIGID